MIFCGLRPCRSPEVHVERFARSKLCKNKRQNKKRVSSPHSPHVASQLWKREGVCELTFQGVLISHD